MKKGLVFVVLILSLLLFVFPGGVFGSMVCETYCDQFTTPTSCNGIRCNDANTHVCRCVWDGYE